MIFSLGVAIIFVIILLGICMYVCDYVYLNVSMWFGLCAVVCDCVPDCDICPSEQLCSPRSFLRVFVWCAFVWLHHA